MPLSIESWQMTVTGQNMAECLSRLCLEVLSKHCHSLVWFHLVSPSEDDQMELSEGDQGIVAVFHDQSMSWRRSIHQRGKCVHCHQRWIGSELSVKRYCY